MLIVEINLVFANIIEVRHMKHELQILSRKRPKHFLRIFLELIQINLTLRSLLECYLGFLLLSFVNWTKIALLN